MVNPCSAPAPLVVAAHLDRWVPRLQRVTSSQPNESKAYAATGFPLAFAAALSVVHGKERQGCGDSRNHPLTS